LEAKVFDKSHCRVLGVKISHPTVVDGGVEVVVYGNGYRVRSDECGMGLQARTISVARKSSPTQSSGRAAILARA